MKQVEMRAELKRRHLITYGASNDLRERLEKDNGQGIFKGNLTTMSTEALQEGCLLRSIPWSRNRRKLVDSIKAYNRHKREHGVVEEENEQIDEQKSSSDEDEDHNSNNDSDIDEHAIFKKDVERYQYDQARYQGIPYQGNAGLPTPEDRLGPPTGATILGTLGSRLYHVSYHKYIQDYQLREGTTEHALTLQYWRALRRLP